MAKKIQKIALGIFIFIILFFTSIIIMAMNTDFREFEADLVLDIPNSYDKIIVREWNYLLGGGAEIYYLEDKKETRIGQTSTDDGYKVFRDGKYNVAFFDESVEISYKFDFIKDDYVTQTFNFPKKEELYDK